MVADARELLDRVQLIREVGTFAIDRFAAALAGEPAATARTPEEVGVALDELRALLAEIERFATKCMRILLVQDPRAAALPDKLRNWVVAMVGNFAGDVAPLGERIRNSMARLPSGAKETAAAVEEAAVRVLALCAALRVVVRERARSLATDALAAAPVKRERPTESERQRARLVRKELELVAADPRRLDEGGFEERLQALPPLPDEPEPQLDRFNLLEVD